MRSLRTRLVLISTLISGIAIVGLGGFSWYFMQRAVRESTDLRLEGIASRMIREIHPRADWDAFKERLNFSHGDETEKGILLVSVRETSDPARVITSIGEIGPVEAALPTAIFQLNPENAEPSGPGADRPGPYQEAPEDPAGDFRPGPPRDDHPPHRPEHPGGPEREHHPPSSPRHPDRLIAFSNASVGSEQWRFIAMQERGFHLLVGLNFSRSNPGLSLLGRSLLAGIPAAICLIGFGGWLVADRALRPLQKITETAARITVQDLSERMPENPHSDPEIARLTEVLNGMMDRLELSFTHAIRFSADASHELRTPIAVMQGEIESALRDCKPGSTEENAMLVLREELNRLKSIIRSLMMLSQADAGGLLRESEPVSISRELHILSEDADVLSAEAGVTSGFTINEGLETSGDPVLLRQAFLNLINNAIKYNVDGGFVRVSARAENENIIVEVVNSGPGISDDDKDRVFDRFYRADRSRSRGVDGFGLGLSLTKAILESHGGRVTLEDAAPGETRFVVILKAGLRP